MRRVTAPVVAPYLLSLWYNEADAEAIHVQVVAPYLLSLWYNFWGKAQIVGGVVAPYLLSLWYNRQKIQSRKTQLFRVPFP